MSTLSCSRYFLGIVCVLMGAAIAFDVAATWHLPVYHDTAVMQFYGWRVAQGDLPYRDFFDMNFPGIYLLHASIISLFGTDDFVIRMADFGILIAIFGGILWLTQREEWKVAFLGAGLVAILHMTDYPSNLFQRDIIMIPFGLMAIASFHAYILHPKDRFAALCGIAIGIASTIKPTAILLPVLLLAYLWLQPLLRAYWNRFRIIFSLGVLLCWAPIIVWLAAHDAMRPFADMLIYFLPAYGKSAPNPDSVWPFYLFCLTILGGMWAVFRKHLTEKNIRLQLDLLSLGAAWGLLHSVVQNKSLVYQMFPFWVFCTLVFSLGCAGLIRSPFRARRIGGMLAISLMFAVLSPPLNPPPTDADIADLLQLRPQLTQDFHTAKQAAARHLNLAENTLAIQFFGFTHDDFFHLQYSQNVAPVTKFYNSLCLYPEKFPSPYFSRECSSLIDQLRLKKPALIFISSETWPFEEGLVWPLLAENSAWHTLLTNDYRLFLQREKYRIFMRQY